MFDSEWLTDLLAASYYHNTVVDWLRFFVAAVLLALTFHVIRNRVGARLSEFAKTTASTFDDLIAGWITKTKLIVLWGLSMWIATSLLSLPDRATRTVAGVTLVLVLLQLAIWGNSLVGFLVRSYVHLDENDDTSASTATALTFVGRLFLWTVIVLVGLQNLGVEITALVASLGVGGIAVALAAQNVLGDLFASLSILLDRPFVVGDFIIIDDLLGTVEKVGLKTTRIRSLHGEQLVFANNDLLSSRIRNYKRMSRRRIVFGFGVLYQTPYEKVAKIPRIVRHAIEERDQATFDRAHFSRFGDSSLDFEVVYWIENPDYNAYMDVQQDINLALLRQFQRENISFAYPTRTLFLEGRNEAASSGDRTDNHIELRARPN